MIRRPPRSTLFPTRRSSDLSGRDDASRPIDFSGIRQQRPVDRRNLLRMDAQLCTEAEGTCKSEIDRKSTRLNSSHSQISYAVFCLKKKKQLQQFGLTPLDL